MTQLECLPYGVGHADEGVCLLVRMGPYRILLDCGLRDISSLIGQGADAPPADVVLCSHAHADHARGLLSLHQAFPELPIYSSEVTTQLLPLNWTDESEPVGMFSHALPWRSPVEFQDGLTAELFPAGHLPGAAVILLTYIPPTTGPDSRAHTLLYTGDFFLSNSRLVEGLRLEELRGLEPDVLIVEGSYGTARYPHRRQQENQLAERISGAIAQRQSVLLPLPTLGLGQELLMLLRSHHLFTGRDLDIWVNGSIAAGCDAYLELLPSLPGAVQNFARHQPLFWDERVRPRVRHLPVEQRALVSQNPCIVLTDLTMNLSQFCQSEEDSWVILLPQHVSQQEVGAEIELSIPHPTLETYLLAQHCDGPSTTQLIHNLRPQHVIFVHGAPNYLADLTALEELHNRYHLHSPSAGSLVELPIGETFLQPAAPDNSYEGELAELGSVVTITLPDSVMADPRWRILADTGLVEARWQGEELVVRGLHQRELLTQGGDRLSAWSDGMLKDCCLNCRHFRGQRCWNPKSPLFNFKVTPDGYCPVFEAVPSIEASLEETDNLDTTD
ncbi:MAG: MBL fold metallo-hydrolase [Leptolyngbyaceae cyanobacterium CSU_1_3]|nr:MBL fold metallo-hydrolase [Leptolyngbyaceae cyanobacterium CSU_1_3]